MMMNDSSKHSPCILVPNPSVTSSWHQSILKSSIHHSIITHTLSTFRALSMEFVKKSSASIASLSQATSSPVQRTTMSMSLNQIKNTLPNYNRPSAKTSNRCTSLSHRESASRFPRKTMKSCPGKNGNFD